MMYGSTIFIIQVTDRPVRDPRLWYAPWLFPGLHASMAGLATSGTLTHWFRDQLARDADFATLTAEAEASPKGAKGLICLPYFSGERTPIHDPAAKGAFFGLDLTHTRGDMFRAVLEGIAAGTAHVVETYAEAGRRGPPRAGGGRRHEERGLDAGDVGYVRRAAGGARQDLGRQLWQCLSGRRGGGCRQPRRDHRLEPGGAHGHAGRGSGLRRQYPLWKALYAQTRDIAHALGES